MSVYPVHQTSLQYRSLIWKICAIFFGGANNRPLYCQNSFRKIFTIFLGTQIMAKTAFGPADRIPNSGNGGGLAPASAPTAVYSMPSYPPTGYASNTFGQAPLSPGCHRRHGHVITQCLISTLKPTGEWLHPNFSVFVCRIKFR